MAQSITTTAAGRVNRRFLLLALILATLAGVLSYAAFTSSGDGGGAGGGGEATVVVARSALPPGTELTADMLETRSVTQAAVGEGAFTAIDDAVGQVVRYPVAANQQILLTSVVGGSDTLAGNAVSYIVEEGQRGMAITVEEVVNVGGLALPGDRVDIYWLPEEVDEDVAGAMLIAENVEVLAVSQTLVDLPPTAPGVAEEGEATSDTSTLPPGDERVRASEAPPDPGAATVTLLLTPEQATRVFCADAAAGPLRLAVRAFGDDSPSGQQQGECIIPAADDAS